jgi:hypothetical protein
VTLNLQSLQSHPYFDLISLFCTCKNWREFLWTFSNLLINCNWFEFHNTTPNSSNDFTNEKYNTIKHKRLLKSWHVRLMNLNIRRLVPYILFICALKDKSAAKIIPKSCTWLTELRGTSFIW